MHRARDAQYPASAPSVDPSRDLGTSSGPNRIDSDFGWAIPVHIVAATRDFQPARVATDRPCKRAFRWQETTSKTRAVARGLVLRQVRLQSPMVPAPALGAGGLLGWRLSQPAAR